MLERYGPMAEGNVSFKMKPKRKQVLAPNEAVTAALLTHEVDEGALDASSVLTELSDIDLVDFFSRFPNCKSLVLQDWTDVANNVMRCIAMTMGEQLIELDFSNSKVTGTLFEIILSRIRQLKILRINNCPNIDGICVKLVVQICAKSITELYCSHCPHFRIEPFHWMGGCIGLNAPKFSKLRVLDMSFCPAEDRGVIGLAEGCKSIRFLNLEACLSLTDVGITTLIKANKLLRVINLTGCIGITDKVPICIANVCKNIISLNLNRCIKIADKGLAAIGKKCKSLQALNVAGMCHISELALFDMAKNCPGLIMLNVTGCQEVSQMGLKALIQGIPYVEEARTFSGFKPMDEHIELKLSGQLLMINDLAASLIGRNYKNVVEKRQVKRMLQLVTRDRKIRIMQDYMRRYMMRLKFYYMWRNRVTRVRWVGFDVVCAVCMVWCAAWCVLWCMVCAMLHGAVRCGVVWCGANHCTPSSYESYSMSCFVSLHYDVLRCAPCHAMSLSSSSTQLDPPLLCSALLLQRVWRGTLGRRKAEVARDFARRREALVPYVTMFQRIYRGNQSRKRYKYVADAIRSMYDCRQREAAVGCGTCCCCSCCCCLRWCWCWCWCHGGCLFILQYI
jgi:hypothetical protein